MSPPTETEREFARYLQGFAEREERGALAALRRGLGRRPGEVSDPCPYVDPKLTPDASVWDERAHYLVASLFGLHPASWEPAPGSREPTSFGASFERLSREVESASVERRFIALLNSHREDLGEHLRHAVSLLKAKEVPVDWGQLLHDVRRWETPDRRVQRQWARAFWGNVPARVGVDRPASEKA